METAVEATVQSVLFDLDGTLMDTPRAIAAQLVVAVQQTTGRAPSLSEAKGLIGRPLPELCAMLAELEPGSSRVGEVVEAYRHLYRTEVVPMAASLVFPGVMEGLALLCEHGMKLAVVTSKQGDSARLILEASGMRKFFTTVVGVDDTVLPKPNPDPALLALQRLGVDSREAVFVGDTAHDIRTAQAVPMRAIAVTYGVGTATGLQALYPQGIASDFSSVVNLLLPLAPYGNGQNR
ncbi:HAD family hydrolase [Arthrobacter antioxidans]|uniref:HAD family hydrolase n=1 Tax=Arthrobacter antioxidans TaxID=2895818 RepID=UPI001FFF3A74|nr:HAD family hydrolase [Arthrobacter antioxidans]